MEDAVYTVFRHTYKNVVVFFVFFFLYTKNESSGQDYGPTFFHGLQYFKCFINILPLVLVNHN